METFVAIVKVIILTALIRLFKVSVLKRYIFRLRRIFRLLIDIRGLNKIIRTCI